MSELSWILTSQGVQNEVTRELERLNIDIAALSETLLPEEDHFIEAGSGYYVFWVGKPKDKRRDGVVGFVIRSALVDKIERPSAVIDRIMKLRVLLSCSQFLSIFSVYAPTMQVTEEVILAFYRALNEATSSVPNNEKLIIVGDFSACVGREWKTWDALGRHWIGRINSGGLQLLEFCSEQ